MTEEHGSLPRAGYVYILTNPALPAHYLKIGKTTRDPYIRAGEISRHTGVPVEYDVAFSIWTSDCHQLEKNIHRYLDKQRINQRREFFALPLTEAIDLLSQLAGELDPPEEDFACFAFAFSSQPEGASDSEFDQGLFSAKIRHFLMGISVSCFFLLVFLIS